MNGLLRRILIVVPIPAALVVGLLAGGEELDELEPVRAATETPGAVAGEQELEQDPDRALFEEKMRWALSERLDTLPLGEIVAELGKTFIGTTYTPNVLEAEGPERLIVNLRELDCVTYVENVLAMARLIKARTIDYDAYRAQLVRIRYRGGVLDGYPSRLHYFSDWLYDNEVKGVVRDLTRELGGRRRTGRIEFMSNHPDSYRQLAEPQNLAAMKRIEDSINGRTRYYIPQDRIERVEDQIQNGDVIAMTSTIKGLDIVHTGIAVRIDGRVHLMHAPLVGRSVEISELPLAERIQGISDQDGIVVARPGW